MESRYPKIGENSVSEKCNYQIQNILEISSMDSLGSPVFILPRLELTGGNPSEVWRKWKQLFKYYLHTNGKTNKPEHVKIGSLVCTI